MHRSPSRVLRPLLVAVLAAGTLVLASCDLAGDSPEEEPAIEDPDFTYAFDDGLGNWEARGLNLVVGGEEVEWTVEHVQDVGGEAPGAVRLYLENNTDAGKIWMERAFSLEPNTTYNVEVSYAFGTSDWGDVNMWTIITGAHPEAPETQDDLTYQGTTGHDQGRGAGVVWLDKHYSLTAETDQNGDLFVTIGVWGTYEVSRSYYVDDLRIKFTPQ